MSKDDNGTDGSIPLFLLKTKSTPHDGYQERFSAVNGGLQFVPTFVPVLEHQLLEEGMSIARELLQEKKIASGKGGGIEYGGMIFTSQRAVEAFTKLVEEGKGMLSIPSVALC